MTIEEIEKIKFDQNGLVPCICQDINTKEVLMLAYMNRESLKITIDTKKATYYSRSRQSLWEKGATSGNTQAVESIFYDCDKDALLLKVTQEGNACHTGVYSCFTTNTTSNLDSNIIAKIYQRILERKQFPKEGSYTNYLLEKGIDKILKKVGEESAETIIAAKNGSRTELVSESSDLVYHLLVMLAAQGVEPKDIYSELERRFIK